jgi:hypothetical protein
MKQVLWLSLERGLDQANELAGCPIGVSGAGLPMKTYTREKRKSDSYKRKQINIARFWLR